jgi:hypothetical protein
MLIQNFHLWNDLEFCKTATKQSCLALKFARVQTEDMCEDVVRRDGMMLRYVFNKTEKICKLAIEENWRASEYIKRPSKDVSDLVIKNKNIEDARLAQFKLEMSNDIICIVIPSIVVLCVLDIVWRYYCR